MAQVIDPTLVALVNGRQYAALQVPRRNSSNTAYEWGSAIWTDQAYADPSWITSLSYSKLTGAPSARDVAFILSNTV